MAPLPRGASFGFNLSADVTAVTVTAAEPVSGTIGTLSYSFPPLTNANFQVNLPLVFMFPSVAPDTDNNGLPDDLDGVLNHPTSAQVAGLRAGLSAEEAGITVLGVVGRLVQSAQVTTNVFLGNTYSDLVPGDRELYGIGGSNAVEVIDISRPSAPVKIGRALSGALGSFTAYRGQARGHRLALTGFGARVVDVSDPRQMRVVQSIDYTIAGTDRVNRPWALTTSSSPRKRVSSASILTPDNRSRRSLWLPWARL